MLKKFCSSCDKPIIPYQSSYGSMSTSLMGNDYHLACLICSKCGTNLWGKSFVKKKDNKLYCEEACQVLQLPKVSQVNKSTIFYNNYVNPNDVYGNQLPMINPRFNPMTHLMYQNPYYNNPYNGGSKNSNVYLDQANVNYLDKLDMQLELERLKNNKSVMQLQNSNPITNGTEKITNESVKSESTTNFSENTQSNINKNESVNESNAADNICAKCHNEIESSKDKCVYESKPYHKSCFTCDKCNSMLFKMRKKLKDPNGKGNYCEPCYNNLFGPKCAKCNLAVTPYMLSSKYEDKLYHKECFLCQRCKKNLQYNQFINLGRILICKDCY